MEICELNDRSIEKKTARSFVEKGWTIVGEGNYGVALSHPQQQNILKIFNDPEYFLFVQYARKRWSEHLPKVSSLVYENHGHGYVHMAMIEPLIELYEIFDLKTARWAFGTLHGAYKRQKFRELTSQLLLKVLFDEVNSYQPEFADHAKNVSIPILVPLLPTAIDLDKEAARHGMYLDIHAGNFMARGQTVIFTDAFQ